MPEVRYNETFFGSAFIMQDTETSQGITYDEDMMRYISINLVQEVIDFTVSPPVFKSNNVGIRKCTIDDFKTPT